MQLSEVRADRFGADLGQDLVRGLNDRHAAATEHRSSSYLETDHAAPHKERPPARRHQTTQRHRIIDISQVRHWNGPLLQLGQPPRPGTGRKQKLVEINLFAVFKTDTAPVDVA